MLLEIVFILLPVLAVTAALRWFSATRLPRAGFAGLLGAHLVSLFLVGFLSVLCFGVARFPDLHTTWTWSIRFIAPYQGVALVLDLGWQLWRRLAAGRSLADGG